MADSATACPSCGANIIEEMISCPECGEELKNDTSSTSISTSAKSELKATSLTGWVQYGFIVLGGIALLKLIFQLSKQILIDEILDRSGQMASAMSGLVTISSFGYLLVWLTLIVLFLTWFHKSFSNLEILGVDTNELDYTPGWAVGSFFVPLLNLIWPYRAMKEVWFASDSSRAEVTAEAIKAESAPGVMRTWWGCFVAMGILQNAGNNVSMEASSATVRYFAIGINTFNTLVLVAAAFLIAEVVRMVHQRQKENL